MEDTHYIYEEMRSVNVGSAVKSTDSACANIHTMEDIDLKASFKGFSLTFEVDIRTSCKHFIPGSRGWMHEVSLIVYISSSTISISSLL